MSSENYGKRKRQDASSGDGARPKRRPPVRANRDKWIQSLFNQAVKEVHKAIRTAKGFETQKVVRRLKEAKKKVSSAGGSSSQDAEEVTKLEGLLSALKSADPQTLTTSLLQSKISKDPILSSASSPAISSFIQTDAKCKKPAGGDEEKARSRIVGSKRVREVVERLLGGLRGEIGEKRMEGDGDRDHADEEEEDRLEGVTGEMEEGSEDEEVDVDGEEEEGEDGDSGVGEEATASADLRNQLLSKLSTNRDQDNPSDSDEEVVIPDEDEDVKTTDGSDDDDDDADGLGTSSFLPSLSEGFTMGEYDSDGELIDRGKGKKGKKGWEEEVDRAGPVAKERKNRRGQRARRAIWEQKYGKGAKHIQKQRELNAEDPAKNKSKSNGRPDHRGDDPRGGGRGRPGGGGSGAGRGRGGPSIDSNQVPINQGAGRSWKGAALVNGGGPPPGRHLRDSGRADTSRPPRDGGSGRFAPRPLPNRAGGGRAGGGEDMGSHPSWEAKKKMREKEAIGGVASKGKKIVFD